MAEKNELIAEITGAEALLSRLKGEEEQTRFASRTRQDPGVTGAVLVESARVVGAIDGEPSGSTARLVP